MTQTLIFSTLPAMSWTRSPTPLAPRRAVLLPLALVMGAILDAEDASAQGVTADRALAEANASKVPQSGTLAGEGSFGQVGEDFFVTLALGLSFDRENWGFGLQVPVRLRVIDNDPKSSGDFWGAIRHEDWDELSDFLRLVRYVYVGNKKGPFYVRVGELAGLTVGHGSIMYRYFNSLDTDIWHTGVNAVVNVGAFGGEVVIGDLLKPYLVGGRATVRPFQLALGDNVFWDKLVVGLSVIADAEAPYTLGVDPMTGKPILDSHRHPYASETKTVAITGVDVGIELLSNEILSITPYIDLNKMSPGGLGLHMGVLWGLGVPLGVTNFQLDARTEYRRVAHDYIGSYFDTGYEIERYQSIGYGGGPKLQAVTTSSTAKNGVFFDLTAGFPGLVTIGGEYVDYDGGLNDGRLRLSLDVPALEVVNFSAFYYRINIAGTKDMFALDNRSAIVAQASIPMYGVLALNLRWWRVWQAKPDGGFQSADDWSVGVGFRLAL